MQRPPRDGLRSDDCLITGPARSPGWELRERFLYSPRFEWTVSCRGWYQLASPPEVYQLWGRRCTAFPDCLNARQLRCRAKKWCPGTLTDARPIPPDLGLTQSVIQASLFTKASIPSRVYQSLPRRWKEQSAGEQRPPTSRSVGIQRTSRQTVRLRSLLFRDRPNSPASAIVRPCSISVFPDTFEPIVTVWRARDRSPRAVCTLHSDPGR